MEDNKKIRIITLVTVATVVLMVVSTGVALTVAYTEINGLEAELEKSQKEYGWLEELTNELVGMSCEELQGLKDEQVRKDTI